MRGRVLQRLWGSTRGNALIEFAIALPVLMLLMAGFLEVGRAFMAANAVEKGIRLGAIYAARAPDPQSAATQAAVDNLVMTGTADASEPYLVSGWGKPGASVTVTTTEDNVGGNLIPVVKVTAVVPFDPLLPSIMTFFGLNTPNIELTHEQAYLGG